MEDLQELDSSLGIDVKKAVAGMTAEKAVNILDQAIEELDTFAIDGQQFPLQMDLNIVQLYIDRIDGGAGELAQARAKIDDLERQVNVLIGVIKSVNRNILGYGTVDWENYQAERSEVIQDVWRIAGYQVIDQQLQEEAKNATPEQGEPADLGAGATQLT